MIAETIDVLIGVSILHELNKLAFWKVINYTYLKDLIKTGFPKKPALWRSFSITK